MPASIIFIVAILAFLIAMVALWLVSDIIKKVEMKLGGFVQAHITPIREEIRSTNQALSRIVEDVKKLTKSVTTIDTMDSRIAKVTEDIDKLSRSIAQRHRDGVVQPEEASKKVTTKLKK